VGLLLLSRTRGTAGGVPDTTGALWLSVLHLALDRQFRVLGNHRKNYVQKCLRLIQKTGAVLSLALPLQLRNKQVMRRWATRSRPRWGSSVKSAITPASTSDKDTEENEHEAKATDGAYHASPDIVGEDANDDDNNSLIGLGDDKDDNSSLVSRDPDDDESVSATTANTTNNVHSEQTTRTKASSPESEEAPMELLDSSIEALASTVAQVVLASRTVGRSVGIGGTSRTAASNDGINMSKT
jgi:hypothetical protein